MDIERNFNEASRLNRVFKQKSKEKYQVLSNDRLMKSIYRKFRTTFIGALSEFEESFSHLWGYRKSEESLSKQELYYRKLWEATRTKILNNGNNQARAAQSEISEYDVDWKRHRIDLNIR